MLLFVVFLVSVLRFLEVGLFFFCVFLVVFLLCGFDILCIYRGVWGLVWVVNR